MVGQVEDARSLSDIVEILRPDVLVMDAHMPGHKVGETTSELRLRCKDLRILILSAYDRNSYVTGLLRARASGYLLKDDPPEMFLQALRAVARGERWLSARVSDVLVNAFTGDYRQALAELTSRELEVLRLMAVGHTNDMIARELSLTQQTIKNHIRNIFSKLNVKTRVEAVLFALDQRLVERDM